MTAAIRPGRDEDAEGFIALIDTAWAEFPGCVLDVDAETPELRALASHFAAADGALWAAESDGRLVGMVGTRPLRHDEAYEICRMYVARECRGTGLAQRLLALAEDHARNAGAARMVLWTDTRFEAAHRFYEKHGYVRQGAIRILDDLSKSLEFRYAKPARGMVVEAMDAAVAGQFTDDHFCTAQMATLDVVSGRLSWVNAGHPHPLLLRNGRVVRVLDSPTTLPIGFGGATPHVSEVTLEPGDRVLFFTDGIIEEHRAGGEQFGEPRLIREFERVEQDGGPVAHTVRRLSHALLRARGGQTTDDATLFLLEWRNQPAEHLARLQPLSAGSNR